MCLFRSGDEASIDGIHYGGLEGDSPSGKVVGGRAVKGSTPPLSLCIYCMRGRILKMLKEVSKTGNESTAVEQTSTRAGRSS